MAGSSDAGAEAERATIRPYRDDDLAGAKALWETSGLMVPHNDAAKDIALCRASGAAELFIAESGGRLVGTLMAGFDGHRGWLYYAAVLPSHRNRGLGRRLVAHAEDWLAAQGVPKVNLMVRDTNPAACAFWEAIGYRAEPRIVMARFLAPRDR